MLLIVKTDDGRNFLLLLFCNSQIEHYINV